MSRAWRAHACNKDTWPQATSRRSKDDVAYARSQHSKSLGSMDPLFFNKSLCHTRVRHGYVQTRSDKCPTRKFHVFFLKFERGGHATNKQGTHLQNKSSKHKSRGNTICQRQSKTAPRRGGKSQKQKVKKKEEEIIRVLKKNTAF